ncbi:PKD domain-containing protein [Mucilaginibacter sp. UC70_90]
MIINNPIPTGSTVKDSKVLYTYEYPGGEVYNDGDYSVVATVFNPIADECGSNEDIQFDFNIAVPPVVKFSVANTCFGGDVKFTDQSTSGTRQIKTWHWDFGDGITDVVQNPVHKYAQTGDYLVTLFVTNENDCAETSDPIKIHVSKPPVASFSYSSPGCTGQDVTFTDNSTSAEGSIISWQWDFGDGTPVETLTSKSPFNHTFSEPGDYLVKLTVTNDNGCTSGITPQVVNIYPVPVVDFLLPDACEDDFAQFTDQSTIADAAEADFTYEWNFNDPNATPANPNISHEKNPKHKFLAGNYQVTLNVTSKNGCSSSASKSLTINGSKPKAEVIVQNPADLCSAQEVFFENRSSVNFGEITRLEVTYDSNDPSTTVVYGSPGFGIKAKA